MASGTEWVLVSFAASPDQSSISDFTRLSQERLACSYSSIKSFCGLSIALVCAFPNGKSALGMVVTVDLLQVQLASLNGINQHRPRPLCFPQPSPGGSTPMAVH